MDRLIRRVVEKIESGPGKWRAWRLDGARAVRVLVPWISGLVKVNLLASLRRR